MGEGRRQRGRRDAGITAAEPCKYLRNPGIAFAESSLEPAEGGFSKRNCENNNAGGASAK